MDDMGGMHLKMACGGGEENADAALVFLLSSSPPLPPPPMGTCHVLSPIIPRFPQVVSFFFLLSRGPETGCVTYPSVTRREIICHGGEQDRMQRHPSPKATYTSISPSPLALVSSIHPTIYSIPPPMYRRRIEYGQPAPDRAFVERAALSRRAVRGPGHNCSAAHY